MTPRLRTTGRPLPPLPPLLWPLLFLALLSGPAVTGTSAYAAEPPPTRAPASADDEPQAGSHPGEGRTPPGRAESKPPDHDRPKEPPPKHPPRHEPSTAEASAPTGKPSASASPKRPNASPARPKASSAAPSRKGHSVSKSHSASASAAGDAPKRSHAPSAEPSRTRSAHAEIPVSPEEPQAWEEDPAEQQAQPSARPTGTPADNAGRTPRQTAAEPVIPGVGVLPLGSGLVLVGLGVGFLALRLRRT
ncbi:hypothetical protein ACFVZD_04510 [Streptomyces sp. NPDC058287]|uniref:hypothetical protein n=1 Tax=unclassified Streptomyces TaxID=2593676 RepID=UPI0036E1674F